MWDGSEAIENSGFSTWVREAPTVLAYSTVLALHTFGMAFLVGLSGMIALRALGFARALPLAPMEKFFPLIFVGLLGQRRDGNRPDDAGCEEPAVQPGLFVKLTAIAGAIVSLRMLRDGLFREGAMLDTGLCRLKTRIVAVAMLVFWAGRCHGRPFHGLLRARFRKNPQWPVLTRGLPVSSSSGM